MSYGYQDEDPLFESRTAKGISTAKQVFYIVDVLLAVVALFTGVYNGIFAHKEQIPLVAALVVVAASVGMHAYITSREASNYDERFRAIWWMELMVLMLLSVGILMWALYQPPTFPSLKCHNEFYLPPQDTCYTNCGAGSMLVLSESSGSCLPQLCINVTPTLTFSPPASNTLRTDPACLINVCISAPPKLGKLSWCCQF